jgi:hypothetical protein
MKKGLFNRRIPTIVAILILIIVIGISTLLIQQGIFYVGKAAPDTEPQNFSITNITDSSFTAVFTTNAQADAALSVNNAATGNTLTLDDRDKKTGIQNKYFSHHITVPNLTSNTTYIFKLIVSGKQYTNSSYTTKTGQAITAPPPAQNPLFGKVLLPDGSYASDSIVIAVTGSSQKISAVTNDNGEFILPTNSLRNKESNEYISLQDASNFILNFFRQTMKTTVTASFLVAQNLPPVTLSQQYIFTPNDEASSTQSSQLNFSFSKSTDNVLSITVPKKGETFTDLQPLFKGTAIPNSTVSVSVKNNFSKQIVADVDGSWSYRPETAFDPGKYTLTASSININGDIIDASSNFSIFPQGSQILADQLLPTTRPTIQPTNTPTPTPTPTATPTNTPTPTQVIQPTLPLTTITNTPTPIPTVKISPTLTATPTTKPTIFSTPTKLPPIAKPGGTGETMVLTGFSIILITAGIALLFAL